MTQVDDPWQYEELTKLSRMILYRWCVDNFIPTKYINRHHSSYELKHIFEDAPQGFYITNGCLKGAMLAAGFTPRGPDVQNPFYNISERSQALSRRRA